MFRYLVSKKKYSACCKKPCKIQNAKFYAKNHIQKSVYKISQRWIYAQNIFVQRFSVQNFLRNVCFSEGIDIYIAKPSVKYAKCNQNEYFNQYYLPIIFKKISQILISSTQILTKLLQIGNFFVKKNFIYMCVN